MGPTETAVHTCDENCTLHNDPAPPKLSRKQVGQLRRRYYTVVHGKVIACEHKTKFSAERPPTNNCVYCWTAYFMTAADIEGIHKFMSENGVKALTAKYGDKFVRNFHGFLATQLNKEFVEKEQGD